MHLHAGAIVIVPNRDTNRRRWMMLDARKKGRSGLSTFVGCQSTIDICQSAITYRLTPKFGGDRISANRGSVLSLAVEMNSSLFT